MVFLLLNHIIRSRNIKVNKILVYAQLGSDIQTQRLEVTLVSDKFGGNLKAYVMGK